MANLKELLVNGVSRFIGKVYINDSHITTINGVTVTESPKFTDTTALGSMTGTLGVANGGTGKTNGKDAANYFMNTLDTGSSTPVDADYYISQYVNGGSTTTTYHRRPMSALWEYIKSKISSILGLTATTYSGSAAKVNNHTVNSDVPSNAVFTDTVTTATTSGSGNAVTAVTASNGALTVTKGTTFLTSHQDISGKADKTATVSTVAYDSTNKKITKTINGTTSDVVTVATLKAAMEISGGGEENQNAFSNVKVGSTTVAADSKTDTLELVAGSNVTLTPDATNDKVTIAATDTTYSEVVAGGASGLMTGADKTKLNGIAANANNYTHPLYITRTTGFYKVGVDGYGHVNVATPVTQSDIEALGFTPGGGGGGGGDYRELSSNAIVTGELEDARVVSAKAIHDAINTMNSGGVKFMQLRMTTSPTVTITGASPYQRMAWLDLSSYTDAGWVIMSATAMCSNLNTTQFTQISTANISSDGSAVYFLCTSTVTLSVSVFLVKNMPEHWVDSWDNVPMLTAVFHSNNTFDGDGWVDYTIEITISGETGTFMVPTGNIFGYSYPYLAGWTEDPEGEIPAPWNPLEEGYIYVDDQYQVVRHFYAQWTDEDPGWEEPSYEPEPEE